MFDPSSIRKDMTVLASNDEELGRVDDVGGQELKLGRDGEREHRFVPLAWIASVDTEVHLTLSAAEVQRLWSVETSE